MSIARNMHAWIIIAALLTGAFSGCKKDDVMNNPDTPASGTSRINMRLTDGPAGYDAVYIDIREVEVRTEAGGPLTFVPLRPGIYDLLTLRNGTDTLLLAGDIPPGKITQIRLILGPDNSVVDNGVAYPLTTPSAQQSGLKLNIQETFEAGRSYDVWLDFDAGKSIHQTGSGKYMLKPVIRAYTRLTDGRIKGYVLPAAAYTTVYAVSGTDTFSAIPAASGYYQLSGLPAGTYQVYYDATAGTYGDVMLPAVQVQYGVTTDLGTTTLAP